MENVRPHASHGGLLRRLAKVVDGALGQMSAPRNTTSSSELEELITAVRKRDR